jgi:hypothetical protein
MGSAREHAMERRQKPKGISPRRKSSLDDVAKARAAYAEMMKRRAEARNKRPPPMTAAQRRMRMDLMRKQAQERAKKRYMDSVKKQLDAANKTKQKPTGTPVPQAKQKPTGTPIPPKRRSRGRRPDTARARAMREFNANRLKSKGKPVVQKQVVVPKAEPVKAPPTPKSRGRRPNTARTRAAREFNANRIAAGSKNPTSKKTFART